MTALQQICSNGYDESKNLHHCPPALELMTQMKVAVSAAPANSSMFLGAATGSAELASPDTGGPGASSNDSSIANSVESLRDRSHLFLDVTAKPKRGIKEDAGRPSDNLGLFGLKPRKIAAALPTESKPEPTVPMTSSAANNEALKSFLGFAQQNSLVNSIAGITSESLIPETPTPNGLLYPKNVSRHTEDFAEGFIRHLKQLQETEQQQKALESPYNLQTILTPLTPTLTPAHEIIRAVLSRFSTPAGTPTGFPGPIVPQPLPEPIVAKATVASPVTSVAPVASIAAPVTTTLNNIVSSASSVNTTTALTKTNLMDPSMFRQDYPNFLFNPMPPHSQQNGLHFPQSMAQQQPNLNNIKSEPSANYGNMGVPHSSANINGMCQPPPQALNCSATTSAHQLSNYQGHHSSSSHASELDMTDQERKKLERKRARNRMAASKCRQRKIERIQQLEGEVQQERQRFAALQATYGGMERAIATLQEELMRHKNSGCVFDKNTLHLMSHINTLMNNNGMGMDASM
uniref:BZIP domain-containing protein n=1 Tax=Panagrellus redivivus TaxID=6233 RepID=A0A7E4WBW1_PANRE